MSKTKYIFISGGVISGLGKGVTASSLGLLLKSRGYNLSVIKCETYLNIDSGTINPIEHGDPFLCADGLEADLDLGTYESFLGIEVGHKNFTTMGQIYRDIINKERSMGYHGKTVDAIPTIPNEIIGRIKKAGEGSDICLVELGGTAGEYQNVYNYEAARMMKLEYPDDVVHVHISYVPVPKHLGEPKSKPTQLSIRFLNMAGIQPDFIVLRSDVEIDELRKDKIAIQCNVPRGRIITNPDLDSIFKIPLKFAEQKFDEKVLELLSLKKSKSDIKEWKNLIKRIEKKKDKKITIVIAGKYFATGSFELKDSYNSLIHSICHASTNVGIDIRPGSMVVALPFNDIWNSVKNNPNIQGQMNGFDPSAFFSNANLTMELGTTPDNKGIVVKNIATGNPLIDDLISDQFSSVSSFDPSNQMSFDNGFNIQRIEFRQDEIVIDLVR